MSSNNLLVPQKYVNADDTPLTVRGGLAYMSGQPFSGYYYRLSMMGDTVLLEGYADGKQEGPFIKRFENGNMAERGYYLQGRKTGLHEGWFANGQKKYSAHYASDYYEGNVKQWLENGQIFSDFNYKNGHEDGMQRMYWNDGKIRANYEVKNGRKYGLTGVKNCVSAMGDGAKH